MFKFSKKGNVRYIEALRFKGYDFVSHAFCTRWGGVSLGKFADFNFSVREGDGTEAVRRNWTILSECFSIPTDHFLTVNQIHEDGILVIGDDCRDWRDMRNLDFDGIVTNKPNIAIGVKTADCVPVFLVDEVTRVIGVVHAGWRGTSLRIVVTAINIFKTQFASRLKDLHAVIGPAIRSCCYEVDAVVYNAMKNDPVWSKATRKSEVAGRWRLDLSRANYFQMRSVGVPEENISKIPLCTSCNKKMFFSHRGEGGNTGRQFSFIMLR